MIVWLKLHEACFVAGIDSRKAGARTDSRTNEKVIAPDVKVDLAKADKVRERSPLAHGRGTDRTQAISGGGMRM